MSREKEKGLILLFEFYTLTHIMETLIQAKILKGFRDFLPKAEIQRSLLIEKLTHTFRSFGFVPIDTPALEYSEILLRKSEGETEKQVFRFEDNGGRDVALRFDLTVPFARFIAEHKEELYFPFKRYHIAKVWRGEKPQAGRYREFMQCDFDIVGSDTAAADFDILLLMKTALGAIGVEDITIKLNHRGIFNRFLCERGLQNVSEDILRIVDKLAKIGHDEVLIQLQEITGSEIKARDIISYIQPESSFEKTLEKIEKMAGGEDSDTKRLKDLYSFMKKAHIEQTFVLDPSITRGLDYYTGVVYETFLNALASIGSVCSGGRYDNLTSLYMKERMSGVGSSIGLDRLIAGLEQLGKIEEKASFVDAEIFCLDESCMTYYQDTARHLREAGIACEVFPEAKKITAQYTLAEKKSIPYGILITTENSQNNTLTLKNLSTRETFSDIIFEECIKKILCKA